MRVENSIRYSIVGAEASGAGGSAVLAKTLRRPVGRNLETLHAPFAGATDRVAGRSARSGGRQDARIDAPAACGAVDRQRPRASGGHLAISTGGASTRLDKASSRQSFSSSPGFFTLAGDERSDEIGLPLFPGLSEKSVVHAREEATPRGSELRRWAPRFGQATSRMAKAALRQRIEA